MKSLSIVVAIVALLGLMVYTNPSMDDFSNYIRQRVMDENRKDANDPLGQFFSSIMGGIAGGLVSSQTIRNDYVLFSMYELQFGKERLKAIGIFRNFFLLEEPDSKHHRMGSVPISRLTLC